MMEHEHQRKEPEKVDDEKDELREAMDTYLRSNLAKLPNNCPRCGSDLFSFDSYPLLKECTTTRIGVKWKCFGCGYEMDLSADTLRDCRTWIKRPGPQVFIMLEELTEELGKKQALAKIKKDSPVEAPKHTMKDQRERPTYSA